MRKLIWASWTLQINPYFRQRSHHLNSFISASIDADFASNLPTLQNFDNVNFLRLNFIKSIVLKTLKLHKNHEN